MGMGHSEFEAGHRILGLLTTYRSSGLATELVEWLLVRTPKCYRWQIVLSWSRKWESRGSWSSLALYGKIESVPCPCWNANLSGVLCCYTTHGKRRILKINKFTYAYGCINNNSYMGLVDSFNNCWVLWGHFFSCWLVARCRLAWFRITLPSLISRSLLPFPSDSSVDSSLHPSYVLSVHTSVSFPWWPVATLVLMAMLILGVPFGMVLIRRAVTDFNDRWFRQPQPLARA